MSKTIRRQRGVIVLLLIIVFVLLVLLCVRCENQPVPGTTAVIEHKEDIILTNPDNGSIRIKINPAITVKGSTMQDLNFANYNENRLLRCRIMTGEEYIYDSGFISSGDMLKGDFINAEYLVSGSNEAIAEVYSYDTSENLLGQTNVKITLNLTS